MKIKVMARWLLTVDLAKKKIFSSLHGFLYGASKQLCNLLDFGVSWMDSSKKLKIMVVVHLKGKTTYGNLYGGSKQLL